MKRSCDPFTYAVLAIISNSYPPHEGRLLMYYSPVRHSLIKSAFLNIVYFFWKKTKKRLYKGEEKWYYKWALDERGAREVPKTGQGHWKLNRKHVKESSKKKESREQDIVWDKQWRVWSWLRMNAGGVPNTCKSNSLILSVSGERVSNT